MTDDRFPDTELRHPPETTDLDTDRRDQDYTDLRPADNGPTRGTYPDNGIAGVRMTPDGKVEATATADHDDIRADGLSDQLDLPDQPEAPVPGSLVDDDYSGTSEGGKR